MSPSLHTAIRRTLTVIFWLIVAVIIFYVGRLIFLKDYASQSSQVIYSQLEEARTALKNLDTEAVQSSLRAVDAQIRSVESSTQKYGVLSFTNLWGRFVDRLKNIPQTFAALTSLSDAAVHLSDDINDLKSTGIELIINKQGPQLIEKLTALRTKVLKLSDSAIVLGQQEELGSEAAAGLKELHTELTRTAEVLRATISFFDAEKPRNLIILFQNPSEMRPGGGFIGSYGHVVIHKGNLENVSIHDIYDPDGQLAITVRPPRIIDRVTPTWGARDANWFFDFPASAEKVLYFLNNSKIYLEQGITFDGALALNTHVLQDIVDLVGTIELPEYDLTLTSENFLQEIQREVESGEDKVRGEPKRILKIVSPIVLEHLSALSGEKKNLFIHQLAYHLKAKNSMLYIRDRMLESYIQSLGFGGEVADLNPKRVGEYLGVVNANIAGGKSDAFITQTIDFDSVIGADGIINNNLSVSRTHGGEDEVEWWYRATNRNYLQIYTPIGSKPLSATGQSDWPGPTVQRVRGSIDDDVEAIEKTVRTLTTVNLERFIASNKYVFASWFNTPAGGTRTFTMKYQNPRPLYPQLGLPYEFIFDKQSGVQTDLSATIKAPPGYIWNETGSELLTYENSDPPGRVTLRGTLSLLPPPTPAPAN